MLSLNRFPGISRYCKLPANRRIWSKVAFLKVSGHLPRLLHVCCTQSTLGRTRTCDLLFRSQDTDVYSCLWLLQNCLSKPTSYSSCSQLFTWVTVDHLGNCQISVNRRGFRGANRRLSLWRRRVFSETELHASCAHHKAVRLP